MIGDGDEYTMQGTSYLERFMVESKSRISNIHFKASAAVMEE